MDLNRRSFVVGSGVGLATLSGEPTRAAPTRPNVLIFITDHTFCDALSFRMGNRWLHTPNIDALAARGMAFTHAYCANPICMPSRTAMFTGRYPVESKIQENGAGGEGPQQAQALEGPAPTSGAGARQPRHLDPSRYPTLGTLFRRAGYETVYSGKWHVPLAPADSESGFRFVYPIPGGGPTDVVSQEKLDTATGPNARRGGAGARAGAAPATPAPTGFNQEKDEPSTLGAMNFLRDRKQGDPFMLVVSLLNPHDICQWARQQMLPSDGAIGDAPKPEFCPPARSNLAPQKNGPDIVDLMRRSYQQTPTFPVADFDESKWRQYLWAYYRLIEKADARIGQVMTALRETGQEQNTLIVFTADHGDCQGSHGWNQKTILYEEAARVPLIFSVPGVTKGKRSDRLVNTGVDLLPTLCDFAGVSAPSDLSGLSLKDTILGHRNDDPREFVVVSNRLAQGLPTDPVPNGRMLRSKKYKYTVYDTGTSREALVDLTKDPGETNNLAVDPAYRTVLQQHRKLLSDWCRKYSDDFPMPA